MEKQPRNQQEANDLGGFDPSDWEGLNEYRQEHYSEKAHHAARSIHHQPNHIEHFKNGLSGTIVFPKRQK